MYCVTCYIDNGQGVEDGPYIFNGKSLCNVHFWSELKAKPSTELVVQDKKPARTRGTRLPEGWSPSEEFITKMATELKVSWGALENEHRRFADYYYSAPGQRGVKVDWDRAWCNWMRKASDQGNLRGAPPRPGPAKRTNDDKINDLLNMDLSDE